MDTTNMNAISKLGVNQTVALGAKAPDEVDLFVYGTLKQGFGNHVFLDRAKFVSKSSVQGILLHLGAYPGLLLEQNGFQVQGEIWRVRMGPELTSIDRLEGHPHMYKRKEVESLHGTVQTYEYQDAWTNTGKTYHVIQSAWWSREIANIRPPAEWLGVVSTGPIRRTTQPAWAIYFNEKTGFRALVNTMHGNIITRGNVQKPHFKWDALANSWVEMTKQEQDDIRKVAPNNNVTSLPPRNPMVTYQPNTKKQEPAYVPYVDSDDPGEEPL